MRYKGRSFEKTLARHYPHVVEIAVPLGGFGRRLDTMHEHLRGIAHHHGHGRREGERDITRWLFARPEEAEAFAKEFGGTVIEYGALAEAEPGVTKTGEPRIDNKIRIVTRLA